MEEPVKINPRRIPVVKQIIDTYYNAGQVYEIISQPCTPDPTIVIKAFFANIPMLVWSLVKPDFVDTIQERFGTGHHKRRYGLYEIKKIDPAPPGSKDRWLRQVMWRGVELQQKIGWYFLVIDATEDFVVNWTSMAYRFSGCQEPLSGYGSCKRDVPFEYFHDNTPLQVTFNNWSFTAPFVANAASVQQLLPGPRIVTATVRLGTPSRTPAATIESVWIETVWGGPTEMTEMHMNNPGHPGPQVATAAVAIYNTLELPALYKVWVKSSDTGWIVWDYASLQISGFTDPGIVPDP